MMHMVHKVDEAVEWAVGRYPVRVHGSFVSESNVTVHDEHALRRHVSKLLEASPISQVMLAEVPRLRDV